MTTALALFFGFPILLLLLATGAAARLRRPGATPAPVRRRGR